MRSKLSQRGNWDAETEMNAREVMAHRFSESSDAYDFALCARHRDGSIYGIADGKQCRVGRSVTRTDALKTLAKQGVPREILGKVARIKDDKEFGKATRAISSGRKKQAATITPAKPSAASSIKPAGAKAGALTQTKRKEAVTPDGRGEKQAKIAQLRAELKAKRDKQKETEKPKQDSTPASKAPKRPETPTKPMNREEALSYLSREGLLRTDRQKDIVSKLSDEKLSRVIDRAKLRAEQGTLKIAGKIKSKGELDDTQAKRAAEAIRKLKYNPAGGKKVGGDNLQSPEQAAKYADFYTQRKDLTHKAQFDTDPKIVKATLAQLKEEMPRAEYTKLVSALGGNGSPEKEQYRAAGWTSGKERAEAVLKSLMDNDFRDVMGQELSWRTGMQLDHRKAGSSGGSDKPNNWIWISAASNQAKGGIERELKTKKMSADEADRFLNQKLVSVLKQNASMSAGEVAKLKTQGAAGAVAKAERRAALRDNMPLMTLKQIESRINDAKLPDLKDLLQASTLGNSKPAFLKKTVRGQTSYPTGPQSKSILKMRWGLDMSNADLKNIGQAIASSTYDSRSKEGILQIIEDRFGPPSGLTAAQRKIILEAAG